LEFLKYEIWRIWAIFPLKNPLYRSKSYFSGSKFGEYKRNTGPKDEGWLFWECPQPRDLPGIKTITVIFFNLL
jgi:hypothetical protein